MPDTNTTSDEPQTPKVVTKGVTKPAAGKARAKPAAKARPAKVAPPPAAAASPQPKSAKATTALKMKDLIGAVLKATGVKKKGLKEIVEATLSCLGDALSKGHDLNLPPLGKAKVGRQQDQAVGELIVVKLRRGGPKGAGRKAAKEALAAAED